MIPEKIALHKIADQFLFNHFEVSNTDAVMHSYQFIKELAKEAKKIAKSLDITGMDYENLLVAVWFRYSGNEWYNERHDNRSFDLLNEFFSYAAYPLEQQDAVKEAINIVVASRYPISKLQQVVCDAVNSRFAILNILETAILMKEEINRLSGKTISELQILESFREDFIKSIYYTNCAKENYGKQKETNFQIIEKRLQKLHEASLKLVKEESKNPTNLSDKETEDLFKIAFRNYVHLVSVADSKAGLLINVNSIIISVTIAFVVSRSDKYPFLAVPSFILLSVSFITILLGILASRPQGNHFIQDKTSKSYQTFFFGSFDLIGNEFSQASWENYSLELDTLLKSGKENIYQEMYKEAFNVRKVLGKKFTFLSIAYWVFIVGLFISITAFFISTH